MTDEPTTPAADLCSYCGANREHCANAADCCCGPCRSTAGCTHQPPPTPAADKAEMLAGAHERLALSATPDTVEGLEARLPTKAALTLRCGDLRAQREEARAVVARADALADEWWGRATEATSEKPSWRRSCRELRAALRGDS